MLDYIADLMYGERMRKSETVVYSLFVFPVSSSVIVFFFLLKTERYICRSLRRVLYRINNWLESLTSKGWVISGLVRHGTFGVAELLSFVHAEAACSTTETVTFGPEFPAVALFAVQETFVLSGVGAV